MSGLLLGIIIIIIIVVVVVVVITGTGRLSAISIRESVCTEMRYYKRRGH